MKTTNLFIELLVIGVGATLCILLLTSNLLGLHYLSELSLNSALLLFPFTAITYVLGIVFDRIFDILTDKWDKSIRKKSGVIEHYNQIRTVLYNDSKVIQDVFDYTKNRIRIVRSWMFYFFILAIIILFSSKLNGSTRLVVSSMLIFMSILSCITFRKLTYSFYGLLDVAFKLHRQEE